MTGLELLKTVRFLVDQDGEPSAVQLDIETWQSLLDWLEDLEDRDTVKSVLARLREGAEHSGALDWDDIQHEWDTPESGEDA